MGVWGKDRYRVVRGGEESAGRGDRYTGGNRCIEEAMVLLG